LKCRNCGDLVDPRRVQLGYDYCLKEECQQRCLQRVELAAVGVNKAADYYMRADEVLPPPQPGAEPLSAAGPLDLDEPSREALRRPHRPDRPAKRPKTTLDRLRELEAELDAAMDRAYQRFGGGEITARELDGERQRLIEAFNGQVMSENIRYRSFLRRVPHPGQRTGRS
jgi:hypothetical protein